MHLISCRFHTCIIRLLSCHVRTTVSVYRSGRWVPRVYALEQTLVIQNKSKRHEERSPTQTSLVLHAEEEGRRGGRSGSQWDNLTSQRVEDQMWVGVVECSNLISLRINGISKAYEGLFFEAKGKGAEYIILDYTRVLDEHRICRIPHLIHSHIRINIANLTPVQNHQHITSSPVHFS